MKRRFNYTGRKTIPSDRVTAVVHDPDELGVRSFDLTMHDLSSLSLPPTARVYVEPYVKSSAMRFAFGTVGAITPPEDRRLSEIDEGANVLFRVLIVDEQDTVGRLLAMADQISPATEEAGRQALLPVRTQDLGEAVWQLDAGRGSAPVLILNNRIPGIKQRLLSDPLLLGAILPVVLRDVLQSLSESDETDQEFRTKWRQFTLELAGSEATETIFDPDDDEEEETVADTISKVCDQFVRRQNYTTRFIRLMELESNG